MTIESTEPIASESNHVIEIGCVEIVDGKLTGNHYHRYINPGHSLSESSIEKHGITNGFLHDKPKFDEIADDFLYFIGDAELITYYAGYVIFSLQLEIRRARKKDLINYVIDVLEIGNRRHPNQNNSLYNLCERYYIDTSQSYITGALLRAEIIADLYLALTNESTRGIISDLSRYQSGENLTTARTFAELDSAIEGISRAALCRGVSNHEYPLLPSLFRHPDVEDIDRREQNLLWVFKTHAKAHLARLPESEVEWLTIAQQHGLPTRLLDWSLSPLVACFFAVQSLSETDAAIYIYDIGKFTKEEDINVSTLSQITAFFPSHATKRITAQSGMFTIHPTEEMKLESTAIRKIKIPAERKKYFIEKLVKYGIHHGTIFPDLDGLSSYIRYMNEYR